MRSLSKKLLLTTALSLFILPNLTKAQTAPISYTLLSSASSSGRIVSPQGGVYYYSVSGTFGGASVALKETFAGTTTTLETDTTSSTTPTQYCIPQGATVQATITGGSGVSVSATLGGTGGGGCSSSSGTTVTTQPADSASLISSTQTGGAANSVLPNFPISTLGYGSASVDVTSIGYNTVVVQESISSGNWFQVGNSFYTTTGLATYPVIGTQLRLVNTSGYGGTISADVQLRPTPIAPGNASSTSSVSLPADIQNVYNTANGNGVGIATYYYTNPAEIPNNNAGSLLVNPFSGLKVDTESSIPSYISSFAVTPSTTGVFAQICGPSSGIDVKVKGFDITGYATTAGLSTIQAIKTSTASIGGTSVTPAIMDSSDSADTATVNYFSTPPTAGTSAGVVFNQPDYLNVSSGTMNTLSKSYGVNNLKSILLRTTSQCLQFSTTGTLPSGATFYVNIYHTVE